MPAFLVPLTLNSDQSALLAKLKGNGCEAIQTANGLCVKAGMGRSELEELLGTSVEPVEDLAQASQDVRAFVAG